MSEDARQLADDLLQETREEIGRADAKASILFAVASVASSALLAAALSQGWSVQDLHSLGKGSGGPGAVLSFWRSVASAPRCSRGYRHSRTHSRTRRLPTSRKSPRLKALRS